MGGCSVLCVAAGVHLTTLKGDKRFYAMGMRNTIPLVQINIDFTAAFMFLL